jgi:hypothetical protein
MRDVPSDVSECIHWAIGMIDSNGHLEIGVRWKLFSMLEDQHSLYSLSAKTFGIGYKRRRYLSHLCLEKVLPSVEEALLLDTSGVIILSGIIESSCYIAMEYMDSMQNTADLDTYHYLSLCTSLWEKLILDFTAFEQTFGKEKSYLYSLLFAQVQYLGQIVDDSHFSNFLEDFAFSEDMYSKLDEHIDSDDKDTEFFASSAYAQNTAFWSDESAEKRREFWIWWLTEAVPNAYLEFPRKQRLI